MFDSTDGAIVLGTDVDVTEGSDFQFGPPPSTRSQLLVTSGMSVERDGFDFSLAVPWGGDPTDGDPAWLTLIRRDDLAVTFNTAELVGDRTFRFNPELPGPGDYLSILEFVPYGYRSETDYGGQTLGGIGGSAFGFYMTIDADGNIITGAEHELITAVEAFTQAFSDEDRDAGWRLLSARCQQLLGKAEFDIEMDLAAQDPGRRVISIDATINGDRGTATYATAHGTYTPGEQPYTQENREEPWINENGWRWDAC